MHYTNDAAADDEAATRPMTLSVSRSQPESLVDNAEDVVPVHEYIAWHEHTYLYLLKA